MKYSTKYLGLLFLLLATIAGCTSEGKPTSEEKTEKPVPVETASVTKRTAHYTLSLPGELVPYEQVKLYAKLRGFVQKLYVDRGSEVKKGQLLARLEAPEITQQYAAASAKQREIIERLHYSQQAYKRLRSAAQSAGVVAAIELEQAHSALMSDSATYQSLKAEMAAAEQLAAYLEIRAPFDGIITQRNVSQGALVGAQEKPLFVLAQQDRLRLIIAIPEKHARGIADNTTITYEISNYPNKTFAASLSRSSEVLDQSLRSLIVEFDVENKDRKLKGGEYVQVEVGLQRPVPSLWVPTSSIVHAPSGVFVLKVENNIIKKVPIEEGIRQDALTEIFAELEARDVVVEKGSEELREGMKI